MDISKIKPYVPQSYPNLPGSQERYIPEELRRASAVIAQLVDAVKTLNARLNAAGIP